MNLIPINTATLKIPYRDMFRNLPLYCCDKPYSVDENDLCEIAVMSMLVLYGDRRVLIDTGVGDAIDREFLANYYFNEEQSLSDALEAVGLTPPDITDVILTHLHFDHCGGCVVKDPEIRLVFEGATHWIGKAHWEWAHQKNNREEDSYIDEVLNVISKTGNLKFVDVERRGGYEIIPEISVSFFHGHTRGLMLPFIQDDDQTHVFAGDLIPTAAHLPLSNIMSFDIDPDLARQEKQDFLIEAQEKKWQLWFQHDLETMRGL